MKYHFAHIAVVLSMYLGSPAYAEWSGKAAIQNRYFVNKPVSGSEQHQNYLSISGEIEYYTAWNDDQSSLTFTPFFRIDQHDDERTHGDIRELSYQTLHGNWVLTLGVSKVYWGVTESQHLVDVINQTDAVENIDREDKLGQPMIRASYEFDNNSLSVFILPLFREATFSGREGRPRPALHIDTDSAEYESDREDSHIDYAIRWFSYIDEIEIGLSAFSGTSREPVLLTDISSTEIRLIPYYPQMQQYAIDMQITTEEWLWKLEAIYRDWKNINPDNNKLEDESYFASTTGLEFTFVGIFDSEADLGLVMEHLYDDRGERSSGFFQNDLMLGLRLVQNDADSTEALLGFIYDLDNDEILLNVEASRRINQNLTLDLELRIFNQLDPGSQLSSFADEDFVQLEMSYHF